MEPKAVGIWIRVSTEDQAQGDAPEHHEQRARAYADVKGWNVVAVYHLEAVSGKAVMHHSECKRMLNDIRSGKITGLIFSKLARLARNTKELLEFADIFNSCNADLISLMEAIDTSTAAGRLFYTMIAAMAQWEREEIASRVAASVPIRAKLGKPLGGQAPYGYKWEGKELQLDEKEAPVRKLMYELFLANKRKKVVARLLNEKGYRTRNGSAFTNTTIDRLLRDPMAKGVRRSNYTKSLGEKKHWTIKPETDWVMTICPAIVSEEVWQQCNQILLDQAQQAKPRTKSAVHLFSGFLSCQCGAKMYVPSRTAKYSCTRCKKSHIATTDLEEIYYEQLKSFLLTKTNLATFHERATETIETKTTQRQAAVTKRDEVKKEMDKLVHLHLKDQIPTDSFKGYFDPLDVQYRQLEDSILTLDSQLDFLRIQQMNGGHILENADNLYEKWPGLGMKEKRQIVEDLTQSITIGDEDITIKFGYAPSLMPLSFQNTPNGEHNDMGSYLPPA